MRSQILLGFAPGLLLSLSQANAQQLTPDQAQSLLSVVQNLNRCRISEAKRIDDGTSPVSVIAQRVASKCEKERQAARTLFSNTALASSLDDVDDIDGVELAVRQERAPDSNVLSPR